MMESWICYKCGGYNVFETMLVRINRLACIIDSFEDLRGLEDAKGWCGSASHSSSGSLIFKKLVQAESCELHWTIFLQKN